jgi:hypothetical protein
VSEIKGDSQAYELAEQRTLLPGERELLAKSGATGPAPQRFSRSSGARRFAESRQEVSKRVVVSWALLLPLVTRMFLQGLIRRHKRASAQNDGLIRGEL